MGSGELLGLSVSCYPLPVSGELQTVNRERTSATLT
jgi:hypothetical protein